MKLNRTGSNWNELERNKINENWDIIEGGYNDVIGQITDDVVGHLIDSAKLIWKEPVDTYGDLPTSAEVGETRMVRESDDGVSHVYRYNGEKWELIQEIDVSLVNEVDRRLTAQLADIAGLGVFTETPIYDVSGKLVEIRRSSGKSTKLNYKYGRLDSIEEVIMGKIVVTKLIYKNGIFSGISKSVEGEQPYYHPTTLIASVDDYMVDYVDNRLYLSRDGGKTYNQTIDITDVPVIKYIHIFSDGSLMFASHRKCYYSTNWINYYESTVLDVDGTPYVPTQYDNFTSYKHNQNRQVIDGTEMLMWGNYSIAQGTEYENVRLWYTLDKGKTVKCCYKFMDNRKHSRLEGDNFPARHVHNVNFNPTDNTFWISTGDTGGEQGELNLIRARYDLNNDTWSFELMGSGRNYKISTLVWYGDYVYWAWDLPGGGIVKCLYTDEAIKDPSQHELIVSTPNDCIGLFIGDRGDLVAIQSGYNNIYGDHSKALPRVLFYSPDRVTFYEVEGYIPPEADSLASWYQHIWAPNSEGKILAGVYTYTDLTNWDLKPSVFLDEAIKDAGFPNAFKPL